MFKDLHTQKKNHEFDNTMYSSFILPIDRFIFMNNVSFDYNIFESWTKSIWKLMLNRNGRNHTSLHVWHFICLCIILFLSFEVFLTLSVSGLYHLKLLHFDLIVLRSSITLWPHSFKVIYYNVTS